MRAALSAIVILAGGGGLASASAIVTVFSGTPPHYFSGTNCRVFGNAVIGGGATHGFTRAKITINGEVAVEWISSSGEPALHHVDLQAMFDSTHFTSGNAVSVIFSALGDDAVWYSSSPESVQVTNIAGVFGRYDLEVEPLTWQYSDPLDPDSGHWVFGDSTWAGTENASSLLSGMGYEMFGSSPVKVQGWSWAALAPAIEGSSVLYVNTHGGISDSYGQPFFRTDSDDWNNYYPDDALDVPPADIQSVLGDTATSLPPGWFKVMPTRVAANGTGLPPFNTGNLPMNLVWVDGCEAGYQSSTVDCTFPEAFLHPVGNYYEPPYSSEDQAFCGYLVSVDCDKTEAVTEEFFSRLQEGYTVNVARQEAYHTYNPAIRGYKPASHTWMAVYGDWATKLMGVYLGVQLDETASVIWSRAI